MNGKVNVYYAKGLFKTAVSVGAGLAVGKYLGGMINAGIEGAIQGVISNKAKRGNEKAQEFCDKHGINYDRPKDDNSTKMKMGFHCE